MNENRQRLKENILARLEKEMQEKEEKIINAIAAAEQTPDDKDLLEQQLAALQPLNDELNDLNNVLNKYTQYNTLWRPKSKQHDKIGKSLKANRKRHAKAVEDLQKRLSVSFLVRNVHHVLSPIEALRETPLLSKVKNRA